MNPALHSVASPTIETDNRSTEFFSVFLSSVFPSRNVHSHVLPDPASEPLPATATDRETGMKNIIDATQLSDREQAQVLREIVRLDISRMVRDTADPDIDIEARIDALEAGCASLRQAMRTHDFSEARCAVKDAANQLNLILRFPLAPAFARTVCATRRSLMKLEIEVFEDGKDPLEGAADLLSRHDITVKNGKIPSAVRISDALAGALRSRPEEMGRKLTVTAELLIAYAGDIRLERLPALIDSFLVWLSRLPAMHGRAHGKNRYTKSTSEKTLLSKQEEIDAADQADARLYESYAARDDISPAQKRAELSDQLEPRVTHTNLERHLDRIHQLLDSAREQCGYVGEVRVTTYPKLTKLMKKDSERRKDLNPLYIRKTRPKIRLRWSGQRIKTLLTSPLYRGCMSRTSRSRSGRYIYRDGLYWIPLILLTMGTRPSEVLQLKKCDLVQREVWCLRLCWSDEQYGKTVESQRIVPVPQVLIDLGFIDWIVALEKPTDLLFPEMCESKTKPQEILSKRMLTIRKRLGIASYNEDLYALRKTLSSALWAGGVPLADRQMIIGHVSSTMIGKHYTEANMSELKELLDRADHKIVVGYSAPHRHPVIEDCQLVAGQLARTEVVFDDVGVLGALRILRDSDGAQIEAIAIAGAEMPARPNWRNLKTLDWANAPNAVADVLSEYNIIPNENEEARLAFEHVLALSTATSESKLSDQPGKAKKRPSRKSIDKSEPSSRIENLKQARTVEHAIA